MVRAKGISGLTDEAKPEALGQAIGRRIANPSKPHAGPRFAFTAGR